MVMPEQPKLSNFQKPLISFLAVSTVFFFLTTVFLAVPRERISTLTSKIYPAALLGSDKNKILQTIKENYYGDFPTDAKIAQAELKGLVGSLDDPYSEYLPQDDNQKFQDDLNRKYEGVGISFKQDGDIIIAQKVLPNSPALQIGVKDGDILKKVDEISVSGQTLSEVAQKVRGPKDSKVKLEFERDGKPISFEITRQSLAADLISLELKNDTAVITISSFGEGLDNLMKNITSEILNNKNIKKIIVDLRSNTGGLLRESIEVISYFLEPDQIVLQEKFKTRVDYDRSTKKDPNLKDYPVAILVDKYSASASEIMAGAIRDQRGAMLVGQKTFGKGVVQKLFEVSEGNILKLTVAEWLTPKGNSINKTGLEPDIKVPLGEDALDIALKTEF
jgi:carboxyl-terminal processing protease